LSAVGFIAKAPEDKRVRANSLFATQQRANHQQAKTMNINISFHIDGTAHCLWTEALPLHELGRLEIHRATNIEFNNTTQQWEVQDREGKVRFFAKSRSACLEWEQQNLQPEESGAIWKQSTPKSNCNALPGPEHPRF